MKPQHRAVDRPTRFRSYKTRTRIMAAVTATVTASALVAVAGSGTATAKPQQRTLTDFIAKGTSAGSQVVREQLASSDSTALSVLGCTRYVPTKRANYVARAGTGDPFQLSQIHSRNWSSKSGSEIASNATNSISEGVLGAGRIQFDGLRAIARAIHTPNGFDTVATSRLAGLTVDGETIEAPSQKQTIEVPGLGTLFVNYTSTKERRGSAAASVNVLRLEQLDGTVVRVGRASANLNGGVPSGVFVGGAWATETRAIGEQVESKKGSFKPIPCEGTNGKADSVVTAETEQEEAGRFGARRSIVQGDQTRRMAEGANRSRVAYAALAGGRLELYGVTGRANVTRNADGSYEKNIAGTNIGKIVVDGEPVTPPREGQTLELPGIGSITMGKTNQVRNGLRVIGAHVVLLNGTEADTVVNLGNARLYIKKG